MRMQIIHLNMFIIKCYMDIIIVIKYNPLIIVGVTLLSIWHIWKRRYMCNSSTAADELKYFDQ